jgi:hypothetical protein
MHVLQLEVSSSADQSRIKRRRHIKAIADTTACLLHPKRQFFHDRHSLTTSSQEMSGDKNIFGTPNIEY